MPMREIIGRLLREFEPEKNLGHSYMNHHVDGMHYLCLHRSPALTVKLYLMKRPTNPNEGFLVSPHAHRYAFHTVLLSGSVDHIRFAEDIGIGHERYSYIAESKAMVRTRTVRLDVMDIEHVAKSGTYFVDVNEIHTLRPTDPSWPLLLGLFQYSDLLPSSALYLPQHLNGYLLRPKTRPMTLRDMQETVETCRVIMGV
jgi:hypothetical protein